MDDAIEGLTEILSFTTDMSIKSYGLASSIAATMLGVSLIFVVWALATKKDHAKTYLIAWIIALVFVIIFIINPL